MSNTILKVNSPIGLLISDAPLKIRMAKSSSWSALAI